MLAQDFLMGDFNNQKEYLANQIRVPKNEIAILPKTPPVSPSTGKNSKRNANSRTIIYAKKSKIRFSEIPSENNNEIPLANQFSVLGVEEPTDGIEMTTTTETTNFEEPEINSVKKTVSTAVEKEITIIVTENFRDSTQSASKTESPTDKEKMNSSYSYL
ncbi:hypothetical protein NPIL_90501 [Nephila pilipes]|uniref:Uncharacterized protein n=1 Tax=Nephila pilipes TaxID=299642 RepID=A0A8X6U9H9_NEPPI|nr:hypothetical protein NPIL_90501 [Nephila pilipes]